MRADIRPGNYIGEICKGNKLGYKYQQKYIWAECVQCREPRWVIMLLGKPRAELCHKCASYNASQKYRKENNSNWKGGKRIADGYIAVYLDVNNPYFAMADKINHYIREHRLIMAEHLKRCLSRTEHVHHKNGIRTDNRIENLELISPANHNLYTKFCKDCELRKEIRLLKWQIKELQIQVQGKLGMVKEGVLGGGVIANGNKDRTVSGSQ